jgi:dipeptidyl aminopeptidase/acylaminoacyl peptidase
MSTTSWPSVDEAVRQGLVDGSRLGIGGWSYGGYLTNRIATRTGRLKAAVSGPASRTCSPTTA